MNNYRLKQPVRREHSQHSSLQALNSRTMQSSALAMHWHHTGNPPVLHQIAPRVNRLNGMVCVPTHAYITRLTNAFRFSRHQDKIECTVIASKLTVKTAGLHFSRELVHHTNTALESIPHLVINASTVLSQISWLRGHLESVYKTGECTYSSQPCCCNKSTSIKQNCWDDYNSARSSHPQTSG